MPSDIDIIDIDSQDNELGLLEELDSLRVFLRITATDCLRDDLLNSERTASGLRDVVGESNALKKSKTLAALVVPQPLEREPPTQKELKRRERYAQRRIRLGDHWQVNIVKRTILLLQGKRGSVKDQQKAVACLAWIFSILGMIVCMAFLVGEFLESRKSPALVSRTDVKDALELPVTTVCSMVPGMPSFEMFPTDKYPGKPLFASRQLIDRTDNTTLVWPATHLSGKVTRFAMGPPRCEKELLQYASLTVGKLKPIGENCYSCFQLGVNPPIRVSRRSHRDYETGYAVNVQFSLAREISYCAMPGQEKLDYIRIELLHLIKQHAQNLTDAKILHLGDAPDIDFALDNSFNSLRRNSGSNMTAYNMIINSFICNVYYASGYFYPKPDDVDVQYKYNMANDYWEEFGTGPYYHGHPEKEITKLADISHDPSGVRTMVVYAHDRGSTLRPAFTNQMGSISELKTGIFLFTKSTDEDTVFVDSVQPAAVQFFQIIRERYHLFEAALDFSNFNVKVRTRIPSITVSELVNDIFQYGALFTGVCVYSVLVGPTKWYLKRSAEKREARMSSV